MMGTVVLVGGLADVTLETAPYLSAYTDPISFFDVLDLFTHPDGFPNNLVTDTERPLEVSPPAGEGVDVGAAHAAALNLDVDVVLLEGLGGELGLVEFGVGLGRVHHEPLECLWVAHCW